MKKNSDLKKEMNKIEKWETLLILDEHFKEGEGVLMVSLNKDSTPTLYESIDEISLAGFQKAYLNEEEDKILVESDQEEYILELI